MSKAVGRALRVEIDNYVVIGFEGVKRLVNAVGGVNVVLDKTIRDPVYWLTPTKRGVTFKAGKNHLNGERALIFARTRKADNDFERARRQQKLVAAAVGSVKKLGLLQLPELISVARDYVKTDLPHGPGAADLRDRRIGQDEQGDRIVFGPRKWATVDAAARPSRSRSARLDRARVPSVDHAEPTRSRLLPSSNGLVGGLVRKLDQTRRGPRSSVDRATAF